MASYNLTNINQLLILFIIFSLIFFWLLWSLTRKDQCSKYCFIILIVMVAATIAIFYFLIGEILLLLDHYRINTHVQITLIILGLPALLIGYVSRFLLVYYLPDYQNKKKICIVGYMAIFFTVGVFILTILYYIGSAKWRLNDINDQSMIFLLTIMIIFISTHFLGWVSLFHQKNWYISVVAIVSPLIAYGCLSGWS